MQVVIITEGGAKVGLGHVTRCKSVYQAFAQRNITPLYIINGDKSVSAELAGMNAVFLDWIKNKKILGTLLKNADIIILDSYLADASFPGFLKKFGGINVFLDDKNERRYQDGIVINGAPGAENLGYPVDDRVHYLLGSRYAPLRREFWSVDDKIINQSLTQVLVTLGGSDTGKVMLAVMEHLNRFFPDVIKNVVIGGGPGNKDMCSPFMDKNTNLFSNLNAADMKGLMAGADIAISACGQTLQELARSGVPTVAISIADNQLNNALFWGKAGFIEYAGRHDEPGLAERLERKIRILKSREEREKRSLAGRSIIDGCGSIRIAKYIINYYYDINISFRTAGRSDCIGVFHISNDPEVRRNSFNQNPIELDEHRAWFKNIINDKNCMFFVAKLKKELAGQIRFNIEKSEAVISISIAPDFRDAGIGGILFRKSLDFIKNNRPEINTVMALVKKENIPSRKYFEKQKFVLTGEIIINGAPACEYRYDIE